MGVALSVAAYSLSANVRLECPPPPMLRATLRALGRGADAPSLGLRLAPRWHGLSTAATKRTLTLEEAMTSSHMILQSLQSPTTVAQVGEVAWLGLGLLVFG